MQEGRKEEETSILRSARGKLIALKKKFSLAFKHGKIPENPNFS